MRVSSLCVVACLGLLHCPRYDIEAYQRVEQLIGKKLPAFECEEATVLTLLERVSEAQRIAALQIRESGGVGPKSGKRAHRTKGDDGEVDEGEEAEAVLLESADKRRRLGKVCVWDCASPYVC